MFHLVANCLFYFKDAGPVRNLSISTVNMSTVIVSWLPPEEANGIIEHYNISLRMYKGNELQKYNTSENQQTHIIKELGQYKLLLRDYLIIMYYNFNRNCNTI